MEENRKTFLEKKKRYTIEMESMRTKSRIAKKEKGMKKNINCPIGQFIMVEREKEKEGDKEGDKEKDKGDKCRKEVEEYIKKFLPFISVECHKLLYIRDSLLNNKQYIHFHIFAIWFLSHYNVSIQQFDLYEIFLGFKNIPFYSFLHHIMNQE